MTILQTIDSQEILEKFFKSKRVYTVYYTLDAKSFTSQNSFPKISTPFSASRKCAHYEWAQYFFGLLEINDFPYLFLTQKVSLRSSFLNFPIIYSENLV